MDRKNRKRASSVNSTNPAMKLLEKRRLMFEVHEAYENQLFQFKQQEDEFKSKEKEIKKKDEEIQTELLKFCKELQVNETKKKKAISLYQSERAEKDKKIKEIAKLQHDLSLDQQIFENVERKAERLKKYVEYLNSIIKAYPDKYSDLDSITDRYKRLMISHQILKQEHEKMEIDCEKMKFTITQYEKEKNHEVLQLNNDIKDYQKLIEEKIIERNQLLAEKEEEENRITEENLNLGRIFMAIDNINQRCLDGYQKIKQDYEDQNKEKEKVIKQVREEKKPLKYQQEEENFDIKCQQASLKLKQIVQNLNDFRKIIEGCRNEIKNKYK
ncbi:unnamed protein product [Paramecium sonneborni]|uniref:DUF4200 domain-containing protein n=1 Tax=Paramecium sonneborni TaxID=65129 RepID=A0A8S1M226_9CILI|nr:unnamed protein product [Paramecium sonneborni]